MEAHQDPEGGRNRRNAYIIGFLAAAVIGLGVGLVIALTGNDDKKSSTTAATQATQSTETEPPKTVTQTEPPKTVTKTTSEPAQITQAQAKDQARQAGSAKARDAGIDIPPSDFDAQCTGLGGGSSALTWNCTVTSASGQCAGEVVVVATDSGAAARQDTIGCGE